MLVSNVFNELKKLHFIFKLLLIDQKLLLFFVSFDALKVEPLRKYI